jgi:hypothetical protein
VSDENGDAVDEGEMQDSDRELTVLCLSCLQKGRRSTTQASILWYTVSGSHVTSSLFLSITPIRSGVISPRILNLGTP